MNGQKTAVFFTELSELGLIAFNGPDAQTFLHGQLTCDVTGLPPRVSTYGGYCTPKGRLLATFLLWRTAEGFLMQLPAVLRESVQKRLSMYILRSKVKAQDATAAFAKFGVGGSTAADAVEAVCGTAPDKAPAAWESGTATVIRLPGDRFEIIAPVAESENLRKALAAIARPAGFDEWMRGDVLAGIPVILPATQEAFVPQMVNLDLIGAVSYQKGCYPGQEIVARTHYLGRLKQRAYRAHVAQTATAPKPGDALYSAEFGEQASGTVVNAAPASEGGYDILAVIQTRVSAAPVRWNAPDGPVLDMRALPYAL